ncbi:uncharacterized protein MONBRDRAFT_33087 [Monosiga brevicollis MX1]|uniref:Uncharacterized protein n=1 Tax=Monosiga brevicollis TaxID=81824 RepID=A9V3M1_MONBE|nr:uncharacterized protein MONBRDRAFT_33087 [Monosiga brevicollis MX1]EDQ87725.1 predicted protein [Monosiga brevicollis MX1]|eukprot:XP_001747258.1 hypothetical protein [Monosiga brevicollis MX1]
MPPVFIKGGVWTNVEDEVLKAAVMKYGPNQWDRVASLLHRKSAKQCKYRWYEWLDPSIKKTEWSREEEEKLLHLAKTMSSQWRTIAPMIGRTPIQCLERYEKLLDQAQNAGGAAGEADAADHHDARRLRPGEIDPNPHTRPARPDPVDMDEDEKEMLSEARARLANTQGKKAKRKARERQLEEAKRLARLQKQRELRAAGINVRERKRRGRNVDYNAEIPFQRTPAPGFYDAGADDPVRPRVKQGMRSDVEGVPRKVREEQERREEQKKLEELKKKDMAAALRKIHRVSGDEPTNKRSKLLLPAPQVSDRDLEDLVKLSKSGAEAAAEVDGKGASNSLLQNYAETPSFHAARTPRAPQEKDSLLTEAQNIIALNQTSSVLEGGANTPLHDNGGYFDGMTPKRKEVATPNRVLTTPYRGSNVAVTPGRNTSGAIPDAANTPLRDKLGINKSSDSSLITPRNRQELERNKDLRSSLRDGLASLPAPRKDYDIMVPDVEEEEQDATAVREEDAAANDARRAERARQNEAANFKLQTQAYQRKLSLPKTVNDKILRNADLTDPLLIADEIVKEEMLQLLRSDKGEIRRLPLLQASAKADAEAVLQAEMEALAAEAGDTDLVARHQRFVAARAAQLDAIVHVPSQQKFARVETVSQKEKIEGLEVEHRQLREHMAKDNKKAAKLEKRLNIALGGYQKRAQGLRQSIEEMVMEMAECQAQLKGFEVLRLAELAAIPERLGELKARVSAQEAKQTALQLRYKALTDALTA